MKKRTKINYYTDSTIHPTIYINEFNSIDTIDYIVEKPPQVTRKGTITKPVKEPPKKIKIKVKKKSKADQEVIEKDCRKNPQRCIDLSIEKGKELVCNETSGRCVNKPKDDKPNDIDNDKPKDDNLDQDVYSGGIAIEPLRESTGKLSYGEAVATFLLNIYNLNSL